MLHNHPVGGFNPSEKYEFVSWENKIHVPNHQPVISLVALSMETLIIWMCWREMRWNHPGNQGDLRGSAWCCPNYGEFTLNKPERPDMVVEMPPGTNGQLGSSQEKWKQKKMTRKRNHQLGQSTPKWREHVRWLGRLYTLRTVASNIYHWAASGWSKILPLGTSCWHQNAKELRRHRTDDHPAQTFASLRGRRRKTAGWNQKGLNMTWFSGQNHVQTNMKATNPEILCNVLYVQPYSLYIHNFREPSMTRM